MKKTSLLLIISFAINCFSQTPDNKSLIADMNNFYNKGKTEKLEVISTEILSGKYGVIDDELKFNALVFATNIYTSDKYAATGFQKGFDKLSELISFSKTTKYDIPNKEAYISSITDYLIKYKKKYPKLSDNIENKGNEITNNINPTNNSTADKTVTLTVSGTGKTIEEAKLNALRSAIEQAFGAFISSKTEILNDNLVKDEIVSVANGNIQKFDIISEIEITNNAFAMTLNVTVSINKLTSFIESKGGVAEFNGSLLSYNLKLKDIAKTSELIALNNLIPTFQQYLNNCIDYNIGIISENPKMAENDVILRLKLESKFNSNIENFVQLFSKTLRDLSLDLNNVVEFDKLNIPIYSIFISPIFSNETNNKGKVKKKSLEGLFVFRNENTQKKIVDLLNFYLLASNFEIDNGINKITGLSLFDYAKRVWKDESYSNSGNRNNSLYFHDGVKLNTRVLTVEGITSKNKPYMEFEDKMYFLNNVNNKFANGIVMGYNYFKKITDLSTEVDREHTNVEKDWAIAVYSNTYLKYNIFEDNKSIKPILIDFENLKTNNKVFTLIVDDYFPKDKLDYIKDYKINKINN